MKEPTRKEIGELLEQRARTLVLGTALLFLTIGSLWTHVGMGPVFFSVPVFLSWLLIQSAPFLSLAVPRLNRVLVVGAFAALNLYFWMCLVNYKMPYVPASPVFFLVSALTLIAYDPRRLARSFVLWGVSWGLSAFWMLNYTSVQKSFLVIGISITVNAALLVGFFALSKLSGSKMSADIRRLGPRKRYDQQRIHASKLQSLGELTASLAHEISNPLLAIKGYNHQICEELKEPEVSLELVRTASERVAFNLERITAITKLLRSFSRDTSQDELGPVSIRDIFDDTVMLMQHQVKSAGVSFEVVAPNEDAIISGSMIELSQLLVNLLSNARDACQGCTLKKVTLGYEVKESSVLVFVEDTGAGIGSDLSLEIFKPFFTTKAAGKGTGLGLYIAKLIADRHKAQLRFEILKNGSGEVRGTRFTLDLGLWNQGQIDEGNAA